MGLMNAAVWFGAAVFFTFGVDPAAGSQDMKDLLRPKDFPYFSVVIGDVSTIRYFHLYLACSLVALLHLMGEWLYLGKYHRRPWLALVFGLCLVGWTQGFWLQARLREWHHATFYGPPEHRELVARAFHAWHTVSDVLNLVLVAGLAVYLWRVGNPSDPTRFVSAAKLRS